jgi:anti-sigma-K factor RskA
MNLATLQAKLMAAARSAPPAEGVPYAFEKRVMARLGTGAVEDAWSLWGKALWRSAFACTAVAVALSIWSLQPNGDTPAGAPDYDLESTMVAPAEQLVDSW